VPAGPVIGQRSFRSVDQEQFATLSGDRNPIHLDPAYARRSLFGRVIVHGLHSLATMLDCWCAQGGSVSGTLHAEFRAPVFLDEILTVSVEPAGVGERLVARADGEPAVIVRFSGDAIAAAGNGEHARPVADLTGTKLAAAFPHLAAAVGIPALAQFLAISAVVGMDCPGMDSILSSVAVSFAPGDPAALHWSLVRHDSRYGVYDLGISGGLVRGTVQAFARPRPVTQAPLAALRRLVRPDEFSTFRPLIVGGSRGLGEVSAKLLAAGGADVILTYASAKAEAQRVATEISAADGRCQVLQCDVTALDEQAVAALRPDLLLYFATPAIFARRSGGQLDLFRGVYVNGLVRLVRTLLAGGTPLAVLNPSSVAVTVPVRGMERYALVKRESEMALAALAAEYPGLRAFSPRLPRILTDQTATIMPVAAETAEAVMLPLLRSLATGGSG
jgi:acyl dehydratase/NAD(P)-dependent dehydrogenase (short-subunit alcohol dehydrogenase family)